MKLKLYRFEKDEPARIETINRGEIYLSAPQEFNDPNDCRMQGIFSPELDSVSYETFKNRIDLIYPPSEPSSWRHPLTNSDVKKNVVAEKLKEIFSRYEPEPNIDYVDIQGAVARIRSYIKHTTGVCCFFAGDPKDSLMWAYYADSHKGFCVEYELDTDAQGNLPAGFHRVKYENQLPSPSILELLLTPEECISRLVTTKEKSWIHEKEVRYVALNSLSDTDDFSVSGSGDRFKLPSSLRVTGIITGQNYRGNQLDFKFNDPSVKVKRYKNTFG
ncbi:DUF2971 domain-containing protein [Undibacterium aquatile]|uniref:DUF2971 domain-containing protein n=1 Tax=Undibacterium aquatile TaxID=1537398 RepID=A0ABR6XK83_9BURK|nr:DUF2971 domain-containing protein [Undibacterium aquatile]MBC3813207.1 DUF2971 domain-containing protein [Undibacterium aquatile]